MRYYDPSIARWMVPDPLADMYPSVSPYTFCLNNPINYIDPNGMEVRGDSTDLATVANDLNEIYEGADISVEKRQTKEWSFTIFGKKIVLSESKNYYALKAGNSNFNWQQDKVTSALNDVITSESTVFNVIMTETINNNSIQDLGGGLCDPVSGGANIYLSPRGYIASENSKYKNTSTNYTESIGIVFMHEAVGHGHPVGSTFLYEGGPRSWGATGIQKHFNKKVQLDHAGYNPSIKWKKFTRFPGVTYKK